jgi:SCY1-like protein 1
MWGSFFSGGKDPLKDLGYEVLSDNQQTTNPRSIWTLLNGKKKTTGDLVTIFSCQNDAYIQLAKAALKRMKTLRHPNILVYLDGVESDKAVYVVTEKAIPLESYLTELKGNEKNFNAEHLLEIAWGLQQLCRVLIFLHDDCKLSHGNINTGTVFVDAKTCDWKLACLEFVQPINEDQINLPSRFLPACQRYEPPAKKSAENQKARDIWFVGTLIWEIFNGNATGTSSYRQLGSIPRPLSAVYGELINSNPSIRSSLEKLLQSPFIQNNSLVECLLFLEQIQLKDPGEKQTFFTALPDKVDQFPVNINERKLLPLLFNAYEFGSSGSAVLPTLFKLGKRLSDSDYKKRIVPIITKLFASTDRMTRFRLLQQLDTYVEHLTAAVVNDDIFTHICTGFTDQEPAIREATVKAMLYLAPKLNYKNLNIELMKHFSRLQTSDDQGVIRTNTIVCLGKIAAHLNPSLRGRLLISAFGRGTQDPFGPSRQASIYALHHSEKFFTLKDVATKILPVVCHATIDPELDVRQQAFKTINVFLKKLETVSEKPELAIEMEKDVNSSNVGTTANETSWTSWALTSLSSNIGKLTTKPQQPSVNLTLAKSDSQNTLSNPSTTPNKADTNNNGQATIKANIPSKLQLKAERDEQVIVYSVNKIVFVFVFVLS